MEHEDNAQFASFLQNTQHNLQHGNNNTTVGANDGLGQDGGIGIGIGCGAGVPGEIVVGAGGGGGGKYEELDENRHFTDDDNEWKYISEVHQNEKKNASNGSYNKDHHHHDDNNENNNNADDDEDDDDEDMPSMQYRKNNNTTPNGNGEHLNGKHIDGAANNHHELDEFDTNKASSNTISTAEVGDIAAVVQVDLMHVEMNFDNQQQQQQTQPQQQQQQQLDFEEEDPSSNCTSSLSENLPPQQQQQQSSNNFIIDGGICDDKENADPFAVGVESQQQQHPTELNFSDSHAFLLNPDAKEFVPSFSSNPTSPTISEADYPVGEPVEPAQKQQQQQQLSALSRHLLLAGDDDFVARSPRKGREMDIDGLALPPSENEFEHEAAMRPHELEQEENLIGDSSIVVATGANDLPLHVATATSNINTSVEEQQIKQINDGAGFVLHGGEKHENIQSLASFIDHDVKFDMDNVNDVMKQSMYDESNATENLDQEPEQIENILNSVQPLPTDIESLNNSFVDDGDDGGDVATPEVMRGEKELLHDHDEKDHVSHPPSIEEMQFNLQNDFNASNKDIAQIPSDLDMNSAAHMQESFYMKEHITEEPQQILEEDKSPFEIPASSGFNESLLLETSLPFDGNTTSLLSTTNNYELIPDDVTQAAFDYNNPHNAAKDQLLINTDFTTATKDMHYDEQQQHQQQQHQYGIEMHASSSSPSPHSTIEEKHLVEDTKEQMVAKVIDATQVFVDELEQKMENLLSSGLDDGNLKQNAVPFEQKETNFIQEEVQQLQPYENEHLEELQQQIPNEQQTNDISYEKQITVEATEIEAPVVEEKQHDAPIEIESATVVATEAKIEAEKLATAAAVAGIVAATGAAAKKTETTVKKTSTAKSATAPSTKAIKKPVAASAAATTEAAKKLAAKPSACSITARPRTAPTKTTTTTTAASSTSNGRASSAAGTTLAKKTAAKATGVGLVGTKTVAKTTTTAARPMAANRTTTTASKTTASTTTSATNVTARKSATSPSTAAAKPRPTSSQTAKPAVLAVKPKISPRSTLASQLRNKAGATSNAVASTTLTTATVSGNGTTTTAVKSPIKTSALMSNGVGAKKPTTSMITARPKPSTAAASTAKTAAAAATTTKTFTARPAPKTNSNVPPSTVRRTLLHHGSSSAASAHMPMAQKTATTTTTTKLLNTKSSPVKGSPSASKVASPRTAGSNFLRHNGQTKDAAANAAKSPIAKPKTMTSGKSPVKTGSPAAISKRIHKIVDVKPEENAETINTHLTKDDTETQNDINNDKTEELINIVGEPAYHELVGVMPHGNGDGNNDLSIFSKDNLITVDRDSEN